MIEKLPPVYSEKRERRSRHYIAVDVRRTWLAAHLAPISALAYRATDELLAEAVAACRSPKATGSNASSPSTTSRGPCGSAT